MWFIIGLILVVHFLIGIALTIVVLMQRSKEGGMGAAFGAGVTESLFGSSAGSSMTKITIWLAGIFFSTSLLMAIIFARRANATSIFQKTLTPAPAGVVTPGGTFTTPGTMGTTTPSNAGTPATGPAETPAPVTPPATPAPSVPTPTAPTPPAAGAPVAPPVATPPPPAAPAPKVSP